MPLSAYSVRKRHFLAKFGGSFFLIANDMYFPNTGANLNALSPVSICIVQCLIRSGVLTVHFPRHQ